MNDCLLSNLFCNLYFRYFAILSQFSIFEGIYLRTVTHLYRIINLVWMACMFPNLLLTNVVRHYFVTFVIYLIDILLLIAKFFRYKL